MPVLPGSARDLGRMKTRSPTAGKYREGGGCSLHLDEGWGSTLAVMGVCVILWPMHMHMHTVVVSGTSVCGYYELVFIYYEYAYYYSRTTRVVRAYCTWCGKCEKAWHAREHEEV